MHFTILVIISSLMILNSIINIIKAKNESNYSINKNRSFQSLFLGVMFLIILLIYK